MKMIDEFLNLVFPRSCAGCGMDVDSRSEYAFCFECGKEFQIEKSELCPICREPESECLCKPTFFAENARYRHLISYKSEFSKRIVFALKRRDRAYFTRFIAAQMAESIGKIGDAAVTFAPRSKKAVRQYGFDQAEMMAKALSKKLGVPMIKLFSRRPRGRVQKQLGLFDRAENADMSYKVREKALVDVGTLIIVDDVLTTGSTAKALCDLAGIYGYDDVIVMTLAKTAPKK